MNPADNTPPNPHDATDYGVQEYTQAVPSREYLAAMAQRRETAKSFVKTLGISWLKIRGEQSKSK